LTPLIGPLIVTAAMAAADQRRYDALRRSHYPPERNQVAAHITLLRHLPPARADELVRLLKQLASEGAPRATISALVSLGEGTAFLVDSPGLLALRDMVADRFFHDLTPQDRAVPHLHITVQNKVSKARARALLAELSADFVPHPLTLTGFSVHAYRGGPWEKVAHIAFRAKAHSRY
jgi:2'-5' RNA ligase